MTLSDNIRLAQPDEIPLLQQIERAGGQQFLAAGHPELAGDDAISLEVAMRSLVWGGLHVIELDGGVRGWVCEESHNTDCHVRQISVQPEYQQRGIGTTLMNFVISKAQQAKMRWVTLNTQTDVAWNQPWYETLGFEVVDREDWDESMSAVVEAQTAAGLDWSTRVHMRLSL